MPATQIIDDGARMRMGLTGFATLAVALALGAISYAPALHAFFAQDDFAFLALVRLLHAPWLLFVQDHFPASLYFRPLGVFVWWLVCAAAGSLAWPQYLVNLALHLGCVAALYALLQRLRRDALLNGLWAALFAVHPLTVGTALWLSDRFDLLTTLFSLLALCAAFAHAARPRALTLAALLLALLGALLSKELGVVASAATFAALALAPRRALALQQRFVALAAISALTLGWLAYRHLMLTPIPGVSLPLIPLSTFATGGLRWLHTGAEFLGRDPRVPGWGGVLLALAAATWLGAAICARRGLRGEAPRWHVAAAIATLCLLPGLVQAPVAVHHLGDIDGGSYWFSLIVASRFYHLAFAGLVAALALASAPLVARSAARRVPRIAVGGALLIALVALVPASNDIARDYATRSREAIEPLRSLELAIARSDLPERGCQIYLLGSAGRWGVAGYSDAIAKGLAEDPQRVAHCLFSSERAAFTYFVRSGSLRAEDFRPLQPLALAGNAVPWLTIGDVEAIYLVMQDGFAAQIPASALFFEYRDGTFVDVGADVRAGRDEVDFATAKPR